MSEAINQLDMVACVAAGYHIGLLAEQVAAAHTLTTQAKTDANTLALEDLLGLKATQQPTIQQCLTLKIGAQYTAQISISSDISLISLALEAIQPLPALLAARCRLKGVSALTISDNQLMLLVDTDAFLTEISD